MPSIIKRIKSLLDTNGELIDAWFEQQYQKVEPFFYSSVDLRHSGNKIVPVDTNLFPAGFNLLSEDARKRATEKISTYLTTHYANAKKLLLIPESHTRNLYYLENVAVLKNLLELGGVEVKLGGLDLEETLALDSASGTSLTITPLAKKGKTISTDSFTPDLILVNNDLSSGAPDILHDIEQPVIPPLGMGWYRRRKTAHFNSYADVVRNFTQAFGMDPWCISAIFHKCGTINFKEKTGLECVALGVEKVLSKIQKKYDQYGIQEKPYVFIKADAGTYGMGVMTANAADEVMEINKKTRKHMNVIKEGVVNSEVIIQEGIPTIDTINKKPAEPLLYLISGEPIGCTYRVNENRDAYSNLNAPGMTFENACEQDHHEAAENTTPLCPAQGLVARLASLAATRECYEDCWEI